MTDQAPGLYRRRVGGFVITALNDGFIDLPLQALTGITAEDATALLTARFRQPPARTSVNTFLIQGGARTVLIDTGAGGTMGPTLGRMGANLAASGVTPAEVDQVLITHLHGDHAGGLLTAAGTPVFPRAELVINETEAAFWLDQDAASAPAPMQSTVRAAQAATAPYKDRLRRLTGTAVGPGITKVPLPGHTPGHVGFQIEDDGAALLIWGDVIHIEDVQAPRPDIGLVFDVDPAQAIATRQRVLAMAAEQRMAIGGMHLHFPGFAHVAREADGYRVVTEPWLAEVQ